MKLHTVKPRDDDLSLLNTLSGYLRPYKELSQAFGFSCVGFSLVATVKPWVTRVQMQFHSPPPQMTDNSSVRR